MYTLDFETIRQVLQAHQKTGSLHAEISSGVVALREPCRIEINIMAGAIVSCTIVGNSGQYLVGERAIQELLRLGKLSWTFVPKPEVVTPLAPKPEVVTQPTRSALTSGALLIFPRRIARLESWQMNSLSRLHRGVFALVDGTKSAAKIAEMLSTSPELVDKVLNDLQSMGIITTRQQDGKDHS